VTTADIDRVVADALRPYLRMRKQRARPEELAEVAVTAVVDFIVAALLQGAPVRIWGFGVIEPYNKQPTRVFSPSARAVRAIPQRRFIRLALCRQIQDVLRQQPPL